MTSAAMVADAAAANFPRRMASVSRSRCGRSPTTLNEVFVSDVKAWAPGALTRMTDQAKSFVLGTREVIIVGHTKCGMMTFTDEEFAERLER